MLWIWISDKMLERIHPLIYIYCGNTELWWWWWKWWFTYPIAWSTGCNLFDGATAECFTFSLRGEQAKLFALLIAERVAITNLCECERKKAKEILVGSYPVIIIRAGRPRIQHTHTRRRYASSIGTIPAWRTAEAPAKFKSYHKSIYFYGLVIRSVCRRVVPRLEWGHPLALTIYRAHIFLFNCRNANFTLNEIANATMWCLRACSAHMHLLCSMHVRRKPKSGVIKHLGENTTWFMPGHAIATMVISMQICLFNF